MGCELQGRHTSINAVSVGSNLLVDRGDVVPSEIPAGGLIYDVQHRHVARIGIFLQFPDDGFPVLQGIKASVDQ